MTDIAPLDDGSELCVACGICCDGILFSSVTITDPSEAERVRALRIPVHVVDERHFFDQPCSALGDNGCSIYTERPLLCHAYRCLLLKQVDAGTMPLANALRIVEAARRREVEIRALMNQDVATDGTPLVQLYRQFQLDNHDRLDAPESRELIKRFEHHQAELAEHFEPSMIKA
ncbi:MAG: Fe-S-cluster containining protein [Ilumatobacter sp.]|jgi:Fe-S-cluster containining protein|uniref:YkgJ family cysteine cluster protein n=1 Tax=uncultured Ilumatobacter sp. TaxID=879968 RepID=UPI00374ECE92|tara:strand:- start:816 stop:1337 length:522 start_codon:yes stop_codon:yes gene_type:complete